MDAFVSLLIWNWVLVLLLIVPFFVCCRFLSIVVCLVSEKMLDNEGNL